MTSAVGSLLKSWRSSRRLSQLDLATESGVSQRHLSFVETGRSKPSRELLLHLARTMDVPLRDQNLLLNAAGYAPRYRETSLDDEALSPARRAIELLIERHEPFPAVALDRHWNLVMGNKGAAALTMRFAEPEGIAASEGNLFRLLIHPKGLRRSIVNWDEVAAASAIRLRREMAAYPADRTLAVLLHELTMSPDVPEAVKTSDISTQPDFMMAVHFRDEQGDVRLFSTLVTIGAPLDITLDELVVELFFPADEASGEVLGSH